MFTLNILPLPKAYYGDRYKFVVLMIEVQYILLILPEYGGPQGSEIRHKDIVQRYAEAEHVQLKRSQVLGGGYLIVADYQGSKTVSLCDQSMDYGRVDMEVLQQVTADFPNTPLAQQGFKLKLSR